jgi:VCBS repeat-containing protein
MMVARAGTTVTFTNNMAGQMTLVGKSGFMMGSFGGMATMMGGSYQYTFNSPGTYVVAVSGQNIQCTITVIS